MDSMHSPEFHCIFNRTSNYVDLKGKFTERAIEKALWRAREYCRKNYRKAPTQGARIRLKRNIIQIDRLLQYGFAQRTIFEARLHPKGFVAMTLKLGKAEVKRRLLAQKRAQIRFRWPRPRRYRQ